MENTNAGGENQQSPWADRAYRMGFVLQTLGAGAFAVLFALDMEYHIYGLGLFEAGVALSAVYFKVWNPTIRKIVLLSVAAGIVIQAIGFIPQVPYGYTIVLAGFALVLISAEGMAGKEAYCFGFYEGWLLALLYPVVATTNILNMASEKLNVLMASVVTILLMILTRHKLTQSPQQVCDEGTGPEGAQEDISE